MKQFPQLVASTALVLALAGCSDDLSRPTQELLDPSLNSAGEGRAGNVYTTSNASSGNAVLVFDRQTDGTLTAAGSFGTAGNGSGAGLGNQGALVLSDEGRWLLAVNAGSNSVAAFRVQSDGSLERTSTVASGGVKPISVTISGNLVYVLNAGGVENISGFRLSSSGVLSSISGSARPLSGTGVGPAQIGFAQHGRVLIVTEKTTNRITTYRIGTDGLASAPQPQASHGTTPFGFSLSHSNLLIVSEAFGGAVDASATSSYTVGENGVLHLISGSVPTTETAACWVVITKNGRFAYVTNTGSGSVSGYSVQSGALALLDPNGRTGVTGAGSTPIDMSLSRDSRFLFALNSGTGTLSGFAVEASGGLTPIGTTTGIPTVASGLAAR
ncbi:MAG TPA: beta-propeller fold lactonase family protein [Gemmatimonadales bacterium]|nr:beta-propeller fold lactonase family protein [Gemmatimonadales bacterium]